MLVRVIPRAARTATAGMRDGALLIRVTAPPLDGAANDELTSFLAAVLGVGRRHVTIVSGHRSRIKRVAVAGVTPAAVSAAIATAMTQD